MVKKHWVREIASARLRVMEGGSLVASFRDGLVGVDPGVLAEVSLRIVELAIAEVERREGALAQTAPLGPIDLRALLAGLSGRGRQTSSSREDLVVEMIVESFSLLKGPDHTWFEKAVGNFEATVWALMRKSQTNQDESEDKVRITRSVFRDGRVDLQMHRLWDRSRPPGQGASWRPFHVVNVALNVVSSRRLASQERKAESFVFTPLWCGAANLDAFRRASEYAGRYKAVSLGTAMAISGAALSPNMGYHSSPLVTLLLTLFNVRLGWWFGNPRNDETYRLEGPRWAVRPLLSEALGLTTDDQPYVYLSDGGHFENLGLYEMVRRRCHLIVVSDAGHDPECGLEDLANATRKIAVDLGVPIAFPDLQTLRRRNDDWRRPAKGDPGFTIGRIDYAAVDGKGARPGILLYLKPTLRGDEPADVLGYAASHRTFPHDATTNQWFKESQFESYRSLAYATMERAHEAALKGHAGEGALAGLDAWMSALGNAVGRGGTGTARGCPPPERRSMVEDPDGAEWQDASRVVGLVGLTIVLAASSGRGLADARRSGAALRRRLAARHARTHLAPRRHRASGKRPAWTIGD